HLRPQFLGDPPDRLLVQLQAATSQFGPRRLDRHLSDQASDLGLQVRAAPLADPVGRQLRVEPSPLTAPPLAGAAAGRAIQRQDRDRQPTQKADHQRALFFSTGRSGTSAAAATVATCPVISGRSLALAKSPAM